jgi:hydrogenase nickel incorporation protein HypA/HybF
VHELPIIQRILELCLRHAASSGATKIVSIHLEIGALCDFHLEWMQPYFDHVSRGTVADGARLEVQRLPALFHCEACRADFPAENREGVDARCPTCGSTRCSLAAARDYRISRLEVV